MNEKRFEMKIPINNGNHPLLKDNETGEIVEIVNVEMLIKKMNEQQATIRKLQDLCGESDGENAKLRIENKKLKAKLKEKEEDERLYANEIVELRKTNEEWLQFKELGGDY